MILSGDLTGLYSLVLARSLGSDSGRKSTQGDILGGVDSEKPSTRSSAPGGGFFPQFPPPPGVRVPVNPLPQRPQRPQGHKASGAELGLDSDRAAALSETIAGFSPAVRAQPQPHAGLGSAWFLPSSPCCPPKPAAQRPERGSDSTGLCPAAGPPSPR